MPDMQAERVSNSKSSLITFQNVAVTAKLNSPLENNMPMERDSTLASFDENQASNTNYKRLKHDYRNMDAGSTATDSSAVLYEMKHLKADRSVLNSQKFTPSKIQFQLYRQSRQLPKARQFRTKKRKSARKLFDTAKQKNTTTEPSLLKRLHGILCKLRTQTKLESSCANERLDEFYEPQFSSSTITQMRIGVYPFEYGHPEYLQTHEKPPLTLSLIMAERTVMCATNFWSEVFGSIHIGVAFVITFILQAYRFLLYSLINTLLMGILNMTSDYFLKPLLTVVFNGFIQPPLTLSFNILSSLRDVLEPIADTLNNFMKPFATVGNSLRLVNTTYNKRNIHTNV